MKLGLQKSKAIEFFTLHLNYSSSNPSGIALLIAAMSANGTSRIANIAQIDRGYEDIENRLNALGAKITRVED